MRVCVNMKETSIKKPGIHGEEVRKAKEQKINLYNFNNMLSNR